MHRATAADLRFVEAIAAEAPPASVGQARVSVVSAINGAGATPVVSRIAAEQLVMRALEHDDDAVEEGAAPWQMITATSRG